MTLDKFKEGLYRVTFINFTAHPMKAHEEVSPIFTVHNESVSKC